VFIDDVDVIGKQGGDAYANFGINPSGAIVIARPDGYVGMVAPFDKVDDLNAYFASFMKPLG
jgi:phenol 2-monooxygenase (NADPH)